VVSDTDSYQIKGSYDQLSDLKTYVSGSTSAKTGVLYIYDIFGMGFNQTLQGADLIASSGPLVVMPDFFKGSPMPIAWYPPNTEEKRKNMGEFFATVAAPPKNVVKVNELVPELRKKYPSVEKWGVVGFCWGGKVATLASGPGTAFAATAQAHPALLDPGDAAKLTIPAFSIMTKDEDATAIENFKKACENHENEAVRAKSKIIVWNGTFHGFMAARTNLQNKDNLEYYTKGYQELVDWFKEVL